VHRVLSHPETKTMLRRKPDLLQPLNQVLYGPARIWEAGEWSFVQRSLCRPDGYEKDEDLFREPLNRLVDYLMWPQSLWLPDAGIVPFQSESLRRALVDLKPVLGPALGKTQLVSPDYRLPPERYFWSGGFQVWLWLDRKDTKDIVRFRDSERKAATERIDALSALLSYVSGSKLEINDLCGISIARNNNPKPKRLLNYTFPANLKWRDFRNMVDDAARRKETCELDNALVRSAHQIRHVLRIACLHITNQAPEIGAQTLRHIADKARSVAADDTDEAFNAALGAEFDPLFHRPNFTGEITRNLEEMVRPDPYDFAAWCRDLEFLASRFRGL